MLAIPGIPALALSAAPALVAALAEELDPATVLVGPDSESRPWVESIAAPLGLHVLVGEKVRHGDRAVTLEIPGISALRDRPALLVDDVISSGTTLIACEKSGRRARLIELDPKYVDVIVKRWQDFSGKQATRQNDGVAFSDLAQTGNVATVISAGGVDVQGGPAAGTDLNAKPAVRKVAALAIEPVA